jgi:hypothetical protein
MKKAITALARLNAAEQAYKEGDVRVATRMYVALARSSPRNDATVEARRRLDVLAGEARQKLEELEAELIQGQEELSPGEESFTARWGELVRQTFEGYDQLSEDYGGVPAVKRELRSHIARKRHQPEYAKVLNEPKAAELWELGQEHERDDHECCAYWVYREATKLKHAPSTRLAQLRLAEMERDPQIRVAAKACLDLQECHKMYKSAERIIHTNPERARHLFAQITDRAPQDSELHRAAREHVSNLPQ